MRESVRLAKVAKLTFLEERKASDKVYIALSLGPFGATLKPTQEFRGVYPPPFGPRQFNSEGENVNSFGPDKTGEQQAIDALYEFHLKRLSVFASDPETWNAIDFLAFETVPLTREVVAIRKAVTKLYDKIQEDLGQEHLKPWWISCVFPDGNSPEQSRHDGGSNLGIEELLVSAFKDVPDLTSDGRLLTPPGFGINCTSTRYLRTLTREVQLFYRREALSNPWLVIYPNGNEVYDEESRAWSTQSKAEKTWADEVGALAREIGEEEQLHGTTVGGIIVGGCCKTGPNDISTLCAYKSSDILVPLLSLPSATILHKNR